MPVPESERRQPNGEFVIDNVLSTQPELGPSIPDGGYGWLVFFVTLFFQMLIPSLLVSFGIFLVFVRLRQDSIENANPRLWDNNLLHVPLFFMASWTFFDPTSRHLIANSTWPRLVATAGTCLTCAGILFLWLAMTGHASTALFILSGVISGIGASIQISQCEILLAQYFRLKHPILVHIGHATAGLGFVIAPIIVGHHILATELLNVVLWYQAVILQGLVLNLAFRKPLYLKSKQTSQYNYISTNPDDEEDILSKNSRELQIKRQNGHSVNIERHEIASEANEEEANQSSSSNNNVTSNNVKNEPKKQWVSFEDEEVEDVKFERKKTWEKFEDESTDEEEHVEQTTKENWEQFEDEPSSPKTPNGTAIKNTKNLQLEMAFSDDPLQRPMTTTISGLPLPLFSDTPVNNNNTYSYDILDDRSDNPQPAVFMPTTYTTQQSTRMTFSTLQHLKELTFYKSLITIITTKFSLFTFYALFPSYLYQEVERISLVHLSSLIGVISFAMFLFAGAAYWINVDKKRRPICLWMLCWIGALGYFLISDRFSQSVLLFGAVQVVLSIAALQHVGSPLLGLTIRGEGTKEYGLICVMTGIAFLFFVVIDGSFRNCFRLMALLNFFTGSIWLSNFIYKKLTFNFGGLYQCGQSASESIHGLLISRVGGKCSGEESVQELLFL